MLAFRVVPDLQLGRRHRLDIVGVVLATLGLVGVVFGLIDTRADLNGLPGRLTMHQRARKDLVAETSTTQANAGYAASC